MGGSGWRTDNEGSGADTDGNDDDGDNKDGEIEGLRDEGRGGSVGVSVVNSVCVDASDARGGSAGGRRGGTGGDG